MKRRAFLASSVVSLLPTGCLRIAQEGGSSGAQRTPTSPERTGSPGADVKTAKPEETGTTGPTAGTTSTGQPPRSSTPGAQSNEGSETEVRLEKAWEWSGSASRIVSYDGAFYAAGARTLARIRPSDGGVEWSKTLSDVGGSGVVDLAVNDSNVFAGTAAIPNGDSGNGGLFAFDRHDGTLRWSVEGKYEIVDDVTPISDHLVIFGNENFYSSDTHDQVVYGVDQQSGEKTWKIDDLPGGFVAAIAADGNRVYIEAVEQEVGMEVFVYETGSGKRLRHPPVRLSNGGLLLRDDALYLYEEGGLSAYDLPDWDRRWSVGLPYSPRSTPVLEDDVVYVGTETGAIAIDAVASDISWEAATLSTILRDPIVRGDGVWAIDRGGTLWVFDKLTGNTVFDSSLSKDERSPSFSIVDDILLVNGNPSTGYRIRKNGTTN